MKIDGVEVLGISDAIVIPIYLILIFIIAHIVKSKYISKYPEYKYFVPGLIAKITGGLCFCGIYLFYYQGGDTCMYFRGAFAIANLLLQDFEMGWRVLNNDLSPEAWQAFNSNTWYPPRYMWRDENAMAVCRYSSILALISGKSFIVSTILMSTLSYIGIWKLYRLFNMQYHGMQKPLAYCILFMPSLFFWGSGIMKDTYVLSATCWITYNFYQILIAREKVFINSVFCLLNIVIIINIKSYVLLSLFPGMLLWLNSAYLKKVSNPLLKALVFPFIITLFSVLFYFMFANLKGEMGEYGDIDTALDKARVIQQDLLRTEQYGGNNYYIGEIDGTIPGMLKLAPAAVFTAIYRPMIWEIGSPVMVFSALENTIILLGTVFVLFKINLIRFARIIYSEPILLYAFVFSIIFAFGVGLTSTNFGALVRYKIPLVPFYFSMLVVVYQLGKKKS